MGSENQVWVMLNMRKIKKKLVVFGLKVYAEIVWDYFTNDSEYEVVAFTVDKDYLTTDIFCGLPVIPFEEIEAHFPPENFYMHIAIVYGNMNRLREDKYWGAKKKGYTLVNYISSQAFVWHDVHMGDNIFIFENNTVQKSVTLGRGVILWSGNHIAHHSNIGEFTFISSQVALAGFSKIGKNCFIGVNSSMCDQLNIGDFCWIGHGTVINNDIPEYSMVRAGESQIKLLNEKVLNRYLNRRSKG